MKRELICECCKKPFYSKSSNYKQKYCSNECKYKMFWIKWSSKKWKTYLHLHKEKPKRICPICWKHFIDYYNRKNKPKIYCSNECRWKRANKINICICWKEIKTFDSVDKKYCCKKCYDADLRIRMKWENSHFWKWWKTKESKIKRTCAEYKEWRKKVFERDWYKCVICWSKKQIEADHIKAQSEYPELIYDLNNWRTLCHPCHKETDNYWYKQQKRLRIMPKQ
jgi:hypothetical protein